MVDQQSVLAPNPGPQTAALRCPCDEIMYGGARGGGKGIFLILDWLRHATKCGGKARGLLVRRYMTDLSDFIRETKKYLPRLGWTFREQDKEWVGPDGSVLSLRYLEREEDAERYQGWNLSWLAVDEAGQFKTSLAIDLLRATLRLVEVPERVLRLTANPGGAGHAWIKARYIDPARPMQPIRETLTLPSGVQVPTVRVFIPARLKDNPLCDTPEYQKNLLLSAGGRAWLVKAWLEGDWNVQPDGGVFDVDRINVGPPPILLPMGGKPDGASPIIDRIWQGWDTAYTTKTINDESAGATVGRDDRSRFWILNLEHGHWNTGDVARKMLDQARLWRAMHVLCEGGPAGLSVESLVIDGRRQSLASAEPLTFGFDLVSHSGDKVAKCAGFSALVNMGQVWVPEGAAWWPYLRDQLLVFSGKDGIRDDCVDACGVAFRELERMLKSAPPPVKPGPDPRALRQDVAQRLNVVRSRDRDARRPNDHPLTMWRR